MTHPNECECVACLAPAPIQRSIGRVCGYQPCCLDAYERAQPSKTKQQRKTKNIQRKLRRRQDLDRRVPAIYQFYPCGRCAVAIMKQISRGRLGTPPTDGCPQDLIDRYDQKMVAIFEQFIQRPWGLTDRMDLFWHGPDFEPECFDLFNDHAFTILPTADYEEMADYLWPVWRMEEESTETDTPTTLEEESTETDTPTTLEESFNAMTNAPEVD